MPCWQARSYLSGVDDYAEERPRRLSSNRDDPSLVSDRRVMRTASYHRRDTVYSAVGPLP